jgi:chitinase
MRFLLLAENAHAPARVAAIIGQLVIFLAARGGNAGPSRTIAYFADWNSAKDFALHDVRGDLLTHINYAFALIKDGRIAFDNAEAATQESYPGDPADAPFRGHFRQLQLLKQKYPHLKTLISVGGWGGSSPFSDMALSAASRDVFARSCAEFVSKYGFDGVDIDWEYPGGGGLDPSKGRPDDTRNFSLLLAALRTALDPQSKTDGRQYLLTIAAPASPGTYHRIELAEVARIVDWINLMAYDFSGGWSAVTSFNAPLFAAGRNPDEGQISADSAVRDYLAAGVPPEKLVLGVPFYGHAWAGVKKENNGLFQPHAEKTPQPPGGGGEWTYRTIASRPAGELGARFWNDTAKVPWFYDAGTGLMVSYDDPQSLRAKAAYVRERHLGGVMIWELSQDDAQSSLLNALHAGLGNPQAP